MPSDSSLVIGCSTWAAPRRRRRGGFALLVTITLLAFLVLLLVSLASLTRVETQIASNNQHLAQARQNALMALNIAIGQLQKYTGPDQRTTARADMNAAWADTTSANGRWVGAYGSGAPVDTNYATAPSAIPATLTGGNADAKGSRAKLLNWLVSGNEKVGFDPATAVASDGHITAAPASFDYTPASAVDLAAVSPSPAITETQALLVGANSVAATTDYVAAPLVPIEVAAGSLPGFAATDTTPTTIGRYAWWVGDEGAKARINLPLSSPAQAPDAFVSAQRAAIELMDGKNPSGSTNATDLIGPLYDPAGAMLANVVSPGQLPLLSPSAAPALTTAIRHRFHDLTGYSMSVLCDTYAGGLKKDLSAVLATGATSPADSDYLFPPDDAFGVPTWGLLRSFARTTAPASGLDPRVPTASDAGIAPVLTYAALGLQYTAPMGDGLGNPIRMAMFPLVVLWNPYTATIKKAQYEFGFQRTYGGGVVQLQVEKDGTASTWTVKETLDFNRGGAVITGGDALPDGSADVASTKKGSYGSGSPSANSYVRFIVDAPDLPPGASLIFTLNGSESGKDYSAPKNGKPINVMTPGLNALGHVFLDYGAVIGPGETGKNFRVAVYGKNDVGRTMYSPAPASANMSGGEIAAYLGEVASAGPTGVLPGATQPWYQTISRVYPAKDANDLFDGYNTILQGPAPLGPVTQPTSVMAMEKQFGFFKDVSPLRWVAQNNPRALYVTRVHGDGDTPNHAGGGGRDTEWLGFAADETGRASAGPSLDAGAGVVDATLFEFRPAGQPLLAIGQLQHANLGLISSYPAYPVGNSLGDFHFKGARDQVRLALSINSGDTAPTSSITSYYDLSWLLNRALWDRYFVSTVPHAGTGSSTDTNSTPIPAVLPNPRHARYGAPTDADLRDADKAAAGLLLTGGFNINSTSEEAWRAVLGGVNQLPYDPVPGTPSATHVLGAALSRFSKPTAAPPVDGTQAWAWQGYRQLTPAQIAQLAADIVTEIRNRGPFVSLADFVNRRLVDNPDTAADERFKGVLQAAIDATYTGASAVNSGDEDAYGGAGTNPFYCDPFPVYSGSNYDLDLKRGYIAPSPAPAVQDVPFASPSAFAPQFLTQADVLSAIGAGLSARSDTFTIRTYGEVVNPVGGDIQGRAWCEAVVQRLPDYVEPGATPAYDTPAAGTTNRQMGRRYKIISFRWLSSKDI